MYYFYVQELRLYTPLNNTLCRRKPAIYSLDQSPFYSLLFSLFLVTLIGHIL